jgi:hypothetical protein
VPPSSLGGELAALLESGDCADVKFKVQFLKVSCLCLLTTTVAKPSMLEPNCG